MSNDASIFGKIILPLVFFFLIAGIILSEDIRDYFIESLQAAINFILERIFGNPDDVQIARDSTTALACATDVVARYQDETPPTQDQIKTNEVILFKDLPSCKGVQQAAPITASVIAGDSITGRLFEPAGANQCGATDCGVLWKTDCTETQRCTSSWGGWYCEQDSTCKTSKDNTKDMIAAGAQGMCFGDKSRTCTVCGRYDIGGPKIFCSVIGFELPQDVELDNGYINDIIDYGRNWIGATGQPKYLVYFETFPEYAETAWMYKGSDVLVHAFAIGAVSNLGIGGLKVGSSVFKNGVKYVWKTAVTKEMKKGLIMKSMKNDFYKAASREFGGKAAERMFVMSMIGKDLVGTEASTTLMKYTQKRVLNLLDGIDDDGTGYVYHTSAWRKFFGITDDTEWADLQGKNVDELTNALALKRTPLETATGQKVTGYGHRVSDITGYVFGAGNDLTKEQMKDIVTQHTKYAFYMTDSELGDLVADINKMRAKAKAGTLITPDIRALIKTELLRDGASQYRQYVDDIEVLESKAFVNTEEKAGIWSSLSKFKRSFFPAKVTELDKKADHMALSIYDKWMWEIWNEGGSVGTQQVVGTKVLKSDWYLTSDSANKIEWEYLRDAVSSSGTSLADMKLQAFVVKWNNLPSEFKPGIWKRAQQLAGGVGVVPYNGYPGWKRTAVMACALAAAYASMQMDSQAEKYMICGTDSLCLNWPKQWFTVGNKVEDNSYESFKTKNMDGKWVQLVLPQALGDEGEALALASPCKADIMVTPNKCECKYFADNDKVSILFSSYRVAETTATYPVGNKPSDLYNPDKIKTRQSVIEEMLIELPCPADDCNGISGIKGFTGPIEEYIGSGEYDERSPLMKDINIILNSDAFLNPDNLPVYNKKHPKGPDNHASHTWGSLYAGYSNTYFDHFDSKTLGYTVLNMREQRVKLDPSDPFAEPELLPRLYKTCVKKGFWDKVQFWNNEWGEPKCIKMTVDPASMTGYKNAGFTPNFCRDNNNQFKDQASVGIDAGLFLGSVALLLFPPTSAGGAVLIMGATGLAGGAGELTAAWWDITDRWPADQSE